MVPLEEDGSFPLLPDRGGEHDGRIFAGPLVRVPDLAASDLEDQGGRLEAARRPEGGPSRVVGQHANVDRWDREARHLAAAAGLVEGEDRSGEDPE